MNEKINLTKADLKAIREEDKAEEQRKNQTNEAFIAELVELVSRYPRVEAEIAHRFARRTNKYLVPREFYQPAETK
jgi:hypothetical protein